MVPIKKSLKVKEYRQIIELIGQGKNNNEIHRITGYTRDLIRDVRNKLQNGTVFEQTKQIGQPSIQNDDLIEVIKSIEITNRRMTTKEISDILEESKNLPTNSYGTVWNIRHQLGFQ